MTLNIFNDLVIGWILLGVLIFPLVLKIKAPYGRHTSESWGPLISNRLGWILMESPALLLFPILFLSGSAKHYHITWIFFLIWMIHYFNRTLVFPFRLRTRGKKMPVTIVLMAFCFNLTNGFFNGYYFGSLAEKYQSTWLYNPIFILGFILCITGMIINLSSDNILIHLRLSGETGYRIPAGGLFEYISCPNHFGEIIEWCGFAVMTWSLPGLAFAIWTIVNLLPRAIHHHKWYKENFEEYPEKRKAILPFLL